MSTRWTLASERLPVLRDRAEGGLVSQWSGWLWVVVRGSEEPWPGHYERNPWGHEGWVVDTEFVTDVHCWTHMPPAPIPWPKEES